MYQGKWSIGLCIVLMLALSGIAQSNTGQTKIARLEFRGAKVVEAIRILSEMAKINIVATNTAAEQQVTLFLKDVTVKHAVETLCKISDLWYRYDEDSNTYRIMTTDEYQRDLIVYRQDQTKIFTLLNVNVSSVARTIKDLYGERVSLSIRQVVNPLIVDADSEGGGNNNSNNNSNNNGNNNNNKDQNNNSNNNSQNGQRARGRELIDLSVDQINNLEKQGLRGTGVSASILQKSNVREAPIFVTVNGEHNFLIVRTSDMRALTDIAYLVKQLNRPVPQVLLEMKVLEVTLNNNERSVIDLSVFGGDKDRGSSDGQAPNPLSAGDALGFDQTLGLGNFNLEGGTMVYQFLDSKLRFRIQLLQEQNRVNILSTPLLLAANNRPAKVFIGEERVIVTNVSTDTIVNDGSISTFVTPETEVREIGNTLEFFPQINADRTVSLTIIQESSEVAIGSTIIPVSDGNGNIQGFAIDSVTTANLSGTFMAKDGLTVAVGGLVRETDTVIEQKIPLLGDIPWLGKLFRRDVNQKVKTEVLLLITPHVVMSPTEAQAASETALRHLSRHPYSGKVFQKSP